MRRRDFVLPAGGAAGNMTACGAADAALIGVHALNLTIPNSLQLPTGEVTACDLRAPREKLNFERLR